MTTTLEHNAVMRPLRHLASQGVALTLCPCTAAGESDLDAFREALGPRTRLVVATHASNVTGAILPVAAMGARCRERRIPFLVEAAQTAGGPAHRCHGDGDRPAGLHGAQVAPGTPGDRPASISARVSKNGSRR